MTNLEALQTKTLGLSIPDNVLKLNLIEQGLDENANYAVCPEFELALAWSLIHAFNSPKSWSQGDMSETWDLDKLRLLISYYFNKNGLENPLSEVTEKPKVSDVSYLH